MHDKKVIDSIVEGVTEFFKDCPLLKDGAFRVDALGDEAVEYGVSPSSFNRTVSEYLHGGADCQFQFVFESREAYGLDRVQNIENSAFYEHLARWTAAKMAAKDFPTLPSYCSPYSMRALSAGFMMDENGETAHYQAQFEILYTERY